MASTTATLPPGRPSPGTTKTSTTSPLFNDDQPSKSPNAGSLGSFIVDVPPANLDQMHLLYHFIHGSLGVPVTSVAYNAITPMDMVKEALSYDFLMNELLALSARHLATLEPEKRSLYLNQSKQLQTYALESFTRQQVQATKENCVAVLLFSCMLGTHLLSDIDVADDNQDILERFLHYVQVYRGALVVARSAWKFLLQTEHKELFQTSRMLIRKSGTHEPTTPLTLLIRESLGLDEEQKEGSEAALARLQWVFGAYEENGSETPLAECYTMIFAWPLTISTGFVELLRKRRPEALLVLAHFAVLLHWCRCHWVFGSVGKQLLHGTIAQLGQGWERWLQWPREMIESSQ